MNETGSVPRIANISIKKISVAADGNYEEPIFSFEDHPGTGLYRLPDDTIVITNDLGDLMELGDDRIKSHKPIVFRDLIGSAPNYSLYKKIGDPNIWWFMDGKEICLSQEKVVQSVQSVQSPTAQEFTLDENSKMLKDLIAEANRSFKPDIDTSSIVQEAYSLVMEQNAKRIIALDDKIAQLEKINNLQTIQISKMGTSVNTVLDLIGQVSDLNRQVSDLKNLIAQADQFSKVEINNTADLVKQLNKIQDITNDKYNSLSDALDKLTKLDVSRQRDIGEINDRQNKQAEQNNNLARLQDGLSAQIVGVFSLIEQVEKDKNLVKNLLDNLTLDVNGLEAKLLSREASSAAITSAQIANLDSKISDLQNAFTKETERKILELENGKIYTDKSELKFIDHAGKITNLTSPEWQIGTYEVSQVLDLLDFSNMGETVFQVGADGIYSKKISLLDCQLESVNGALIIKSQNNKVMSIFKNEVQFHKRIKFSDVLSDVDSYLEKSGDKLIWKSGLREVDLTEDVLKFPIRAPTGYGAIYGFINSDSGMGVANDEVTLYTNDQRATLCADGSFRAKAVTTSHINANKLLEISLVGLNEIGGIVSKVSIDARRMIIPGAYRSESFDIGYGFDIMDKMGNLEKTIGMSKVENTLGLETGNNKPVVLQDTEINVGDRKLTFGIEKAELVKSDNNLVWKTAEGETVLNKPDGYTGILEYTADSKIQAGDLICILQDNSGKVCKLIGGQCKNLDAPLEGTNRKIKPLSNGLISSMVCVDNNLLFRIKQLSNGKFTTVYEEKLLSDVRESKILTSILESDDSVIIAYLIELDQEICVVKYNTTTWEKITEKISFGSKLDALEISKFDSTIVVVAHNEAQNFSVVLLSEDLQQGTKELAISHMSIADTNKKISLVAIPGGVFVVCYGTVKIAFIIAAYDGAITSGDIFIDYDSCDCIDVLYDKSVGMLLSLEKTLSNSGYIQILDVMGLCIQKLGSKQIKGVNIEPLAMALNKTNNYMLMYAVGQTIMMQPFEFDGDVITMNLRYANETAARLSDMCRSGLMEMSNKQFLYWYETSNSSVLIGTFELGYNGQASTVIGMALNNAESNEIVKVQIKSHICNVGIKLSDTLVGKKLYISDVKKSYPLSLTSNPTHGLLVGTCLDNYRILLGL